MMVSEIFCQLKWLPINESGPFSAWVGEPTYIVVSRTQQNDLTTIIEYLTVLLFKFECSIRVFDCSIRVYRSIPSCI